MKFFLQSQNLHIMYEKAHWGKCSASGRTGENGYLLRFRKHFSFIAFNCLSLYLTKLLNYRKMIPRFCYFISIYAYFIITYYIAVKYSCIPWGYLKMRPFLDEPWLNSLQTCWHLFLVFLERVKAETALVKIIFKFFGRHHSFWKSCH